MKIKIIGRKYEDKVSYYDWDGRKEFGYCEVEDERIWEKEFEDEFKAEIWLVNNYPEYAMGASYIWNDGRCFYLLAVPSSEFGDGNWETTENRVRFVKRELEERMEVA